MSQAASFDGGDAVPSERHSLGRLEIRIHGRGGQGTVTLAALMVDAAFRSGWNALGFPTFGTERTGAPVAAFVRLDRKPIHDRGEVRTPAVVLVQDPTLVGTVDVAQGLASNGLILLNADTIPAGLLHLPVVALPVTDLAVAHLGAAKTSTAMLGFFAAVTDLATVEAVYGAIRDRFSGQIAERNVALARAVLESVGGGRVAA